MHARGVAQQQLEMPPWTGGGEWGPPPRGPGDWNQPPGEPPWTPQRRGSRRVADLFILLFLVAGLGAGLAMALARHSSPRSPAPAALDTGVGSGAGTSGLNVAAIAKQTDPGVVDVLTTLGYQGGQAAGTGMVLTSSGEVLTNNHVIEGATAIRVRIAGQSQTYTATVLGTDVTDDVALIQLQGASGLTAIRTGDSSAVKPGDGVVAIGNASNLSGPPTVTEGGVTALDQSIAAAGALNGVERLTGLIQTNVPLSPGNSGGPLVDAAGQVIGMNTAAASDAGFSGMSISFAIPINRALSIARQIEAGHAGATVQIGPRGFLGVEVADASNPDAMGGFSRRGQQFSYTPAVSSGALVVGVVDGSPAQAAGLTGGDVIISLDHRTIDTSATLTQVLGRHRPGDTVAVGWVDQSGTHHTGSIHLTTGPAA